MLHLQNQMSYRVYFIYFCSSAIFTQDAIYHSTYRRQLKENRNLPFIFRFSCYNKQGNFPCFFNSNLIIHSFKVLGGQIMQTTISIRFNVLAVLIGAITDPFRGTKNKLLHRLQKRKRKWSIRN